MNFLYSLSLTVTPGLEDDELKTGLSLGDVGPGLLGFLVTLFLVVAVFFLIRDMVKRIRRVRYREQARTGVGSDVFIPSTESLAEGAARKSPADGDDTAAGTYKRG